MEVVYQLKNDASLLNELKKCIKCCKVIKNNSCNLNAKCSNYSKCCNYVIVYFHNDCISDLKFEFNTKILCEKCNEDEIKNNMSLSIKHTQDIIHRLDRIEKLLNEKLSKIII